MKKLIIAALLSSVVLVNAAFANKDENTLNNTKLETAFKQEFAQAKEVSWQKTDNYYKATFKLNNEMVNAFFTNDAELIGIVHNMLSTQLPINLQTSLRKEYENYWITDLFEYSKTEGHGYFITVQNAEQTVVLQSTDGSSWSTYSKSKKQ